MHGVRTVHCNIYVLNREEPELFHEINRVVVDMEGQIILAGDINQVLDRIMDKRKLVVNLFPKTELNSPELNRQRMVNPCEREYTFYSKCHNTHSRINYFLVSNTSVDSVVN